MSDITMQTEWPVGVGTNPVLAARKLADKAKGAPRLKPVDRNQVMLRAVDVERLIEDEHPARAIWELTGRVDWSGFYDSIQAVEGVAGRQAWDPRLLGSLWIYAYSRGIGSAREVARRCSYDPGFQWLTGLTEVNYHTLADFRVGYGSKLDELFTQVLGLLSAEGLITLERVMHDGTKIKAFAGTDSFRREERLRVHLEEARKQVAEMDDPNAELPARKRAAQRRSQRERVERLELAVAELDKLQRVKVGTEEKQQARVSETDPEARVMKQGDGGYAPSFNVQLSTDAAQGLIVGAGVSQSSSDYGELVGSAKRVEQNMGKLPQQLVVDGGFTSRENVIEMASSGVDFIGSMDVKHTAQITAQMRRRGVKEEFYPQAFKYDAAQDTYVCPAGNILRHDGQTKKTGVVSHKYIATACADCRFKAQCCPQSKGGRTITRAVEAPVVDAFITKMQTDAAKAIYRLRGAIAEFPNAWIKVKLGLRQFHVRGQAKAGMELLWACLTYNIQQWTRLRWLVRVKLAVI